MQPPNSNGHVPGATFFAAYVGPSMNPTLREPEMMEVLPYDSRPLRVGDVAFFLPPEAEQPVPTKEGVTLPVEQYQALLEGVRALEGTSGKEVVTAKIAKNKTQQVWVGANIYKDIPLVYIRTYAAFVGSQELKPAKQGVSIRAELYPKLLEAVEKLGKELNV